MYKVFIDHKPIIFIDRDQFNGNHAFVELHELESTFEGLRMQITNTTIEQPLYVLCDDSKKGFKDFFSGYKKIKAAGGIVQRKNKFLVIKRNGLWDIPKGKIEKKEDKELAAIREVEEECGITGPTIDYFITVTYHLFKYKGARAIKKTFWYKMSYEGPKNTVPQRLEGITKAKWFTEEELFAIRGRTYGSINELLDAFTAVRVEKS